MALSADWIARYHRRVSAGRGGRKREGPPDVLGDQLLAAWMAGEENAFRDLFRAYRSLVYGVLRNLMPGDPELDDVVQTAFLEVFRSLDSFQGRSKLSSWVARVALNVGYHHIRRKRSRPSDYRTESIGDVHFDERASSDPEAVVAGAEATQRVQIILASLAPKKRTVFILNDLQGLPQEEVAEIVGASVATVRTRLFYARKEFWRRAATDPVLRDLVPSEADEKARGSA
ncbi:MAG: RNA polymerase sigma factor [Myxococcota bacterium]